MNMKENIATTKKLVTVNIAGHQETCIKAISKMISVMVMEKCFGQMDFHKKVCYIFNIYLLTNCY